MINPNPKSYIILRINLRAHTHKIINSKIFGISITEDPSHHHELQFGFLSQPMLLDLTYVIIGNNIINQIRLITGPK